MGFVYFSIEYIRLVYFSLFHIHYREGKIYVIHQIRSTLAVVMSESSETIPKRAKNIKDYSVRDKVVALNSRPKRKLNGMRKCNKPCQACPYILEGKEVKINYKTTWEITNRVNCKSKNIVYMIECDKQNCGQRYIGETKRSLATRFSEHKRYISRTFSSKAIGNHFNKAGHGLKDVRITILEQMETLDDRYRKEREKILIDKFNTFNSGLNRIS